MEARPDAVIGEEGCDRAGTGDVVDEGPGWHKGHAGERRDSASPARGSCGRVTTPPGWISPAPDGTVGGELAALAASMNGKESA